MKIRVYISRRINYHLLGGRLDQMICSRAYEQGWFRTERVLNLIYFCQKEHCKRCYLWENADEIH
jgi:hypothetical protein